MRRRLMWIVPVLALTLGAPGSAAAQTAPNGWNMAGAPAHSNFSQAEAMFAWDRTAQAYVDVTEQRGDIGSDAPDCPGYWAYFPAVTAVTLPAPSHSGDTHTCTLSAGWNLVGNPFSLVARLPEGLTAYYWSPPAQAYEVIDRIPVGGAAWVYETAPTTITITAL
ncbi:MAG TPA: hypothetical protein VKX16_01845 [Chloroflexota bacterium]|nr:hypothetical protein [Chloroflexota bacterium]